MLDRIREFFRNAFGSNNHKYIEAPKETQKINYIKEQENTNFKEDLLISNEEEQRILKLQRDFKAGLIEEEDLSEADFDALTALYEKQIMKTKEAIENYKNRIMAIKQNLA